MVTHASTPLGDRIRSLRQARAWTQGQLATDAGVKRSWLSNVESGVIDNPRAEYLSAVARTLGVSVEYLTSGRSAGPNEIVITGPENKAAPLRRMSRYPADIIARFDRMMADLFAVPNEPADDEAQDSGHDDADHDPPDAPPDGAGHG